MVASPRPERTGTVKRFQIIIDAFLLVGFLLYCTLYAPLALDSGCTIEGYRIHDDNISLKAALDHAIEFVSLLYLLGSVCLALRSALRRRAMRPLSCLINCLLTSLFLVSIPLIGFLYEKNLQPQFHAVAVNCTFVVALVFLLQLAIFYSRKLKPARKEEADEQQ